MAGTFQHGALTTTATTADQVITSFTPTNTTSWKSTTVSGFLTTYSATESNLGTVVQQVNGANVFETRIQNTDNDSIPGCIVIPYDGILANGSHVWRWIVTPAAATSMRWTASYFGEG